MANYASICSFVSSVYSSLAIHKRAFLDRFYSESKAYFARIHSEILDTTSFSNPLKPW